MTRVFLPFIIGSISFLNALASSDKRTSCSINDLINSISQVKSNELIKINLGYNLNELVYYGDFSMFSDKLYEHKIS